MVTRVKRETGTLAVTFGRAGEPPQTVQVADGRQAIQRAVALLLAHRKLRPGDCLTVELAD